MSQKMLSCSCWLIVGKSNTGYNKLKAPKVVQHRDRASVPANHVCIKLDLSLPKALFQKPQLTAKIELDADKCGENKIDADVIQNIEELIAENIGIEMKISQAEDD